jgi:hypothetical protein
MSAPLLSSIANKLSSAPLGNKDKLYTDSSDYSSDLLKGMRWLQCNVKLPPVFDNCLVTPLPKRGINITEWIEKDFQDRTKIEEKTSLSVDGLCTCGSNAHCLVHSYIKASLYQSRLMKAMKNAPDDNRTFLGTLTMSHGRNDRLDELIEVQTKAFMEMTRRKSWCDAFVGVEPISGDGEVTWTYRHLECTYSLNFGSHPHIHFVVSAKTGSNIDFIKDRLIKLWKENISAMTIDGINKKGQIQVRRMTKKELQDNGRSRYSASTKVGVDIVEVIGSANEERVAAYASKGATLEATADFTMKSSKSSSSFSTPEIALHVSGVRENRRLSEWEDKQNWSNYHVSSSCEYWKRYIEKFYKSVLGKHAYSHCKNFRHYAEMDKKSSDNSGVLNNQKVKREKRRDMHIPHAVSEKMGRGKATMRFDSLRKESDFQKALEMVKGMVTLQDFLLIKVTTPEDRKELIVQQKLVEPHSGVVIPKSVKIWNGLEKLNHEGCKWVKVKEWEQGLISVGMKIRDGNGINIIKEYKAHAEGFKFKVINEIPMLSYVTPLVDVVFPKLVEDNFFQRQAEETNGLKRAA